MNSRRLSSKETVAVYLGLSMLVVFYDAAAQSSIGSAPSAAKNVQVQPENFPPGGPISIDLHMKVRARKSGPVDRTISSRDDGQLVRVGETIDICFQSSVEGYISLWSESAQGQKNRIYPNKLSHPTGDVRGVKVTAGKEACPASEDPSFELAVKKPLGDARISVYWTKSEEQQLPADAFLSVGKSSGRSSEPGYASRTLDYRVVE